MATSNSLRRARRMRSVLPVEPVAKPTPKISEMNIGEKSRLAHQLVKNGKALDLKEAWEIIKNS